MDQDESRPANQFHNRLRCGVSKHRPKVCLAAIQAARRYRAALDAADEARQAMAAMAVDRAADAAAALAVLNHLADSFGFQPFTAEEVEEG
jgi:hypothetical protein